MSLRVAPPHARYVAWYRVGGVQGHSLSWVVPENTEHGLELRHIAL